MAEDKNKKIEPKAPEAPEAPKAPEAKEPKVFKMRFDVKHNGEMFAKGEAAPVDHIEHFKKHGYVEKS